MSRPNVYPAELRQRAIRMDADVRANYESEWAAIGAVAQKPGIGTAETLRKWVRQAESTPTPGPVSRVRRRLCNSPASPRYRSPSWPCRTRCALGRAQHHTSEAVLIRVVKRCTDEPAAESPIAICRTYEHVAEISPAA